MEQVLHLRYIAAAVVYSLLGIVVLIFAVWVFDKLTPGDLWKEIVDHKNMPLSIAVAAAILAIGNIIASAIHG